MRAWQCVDCSAVLVDVTGRVGGIQSETPQECGVCGAGEWKEVSASGYTAEQGLPTAVRLTVIATEVLRLPDKKERANR